MQASLWKQTGVDGMVLQYFTNVYSIEDLNEMTPQIKQMLLNALATNER